MKTSKFFFFLSVFFLLSQIPFIANSQENEKKVHVKVIKNGETTVDTTFAIKDIENDDLHKKISELAGIDFDVKTGSDIVIIEDDLHHKKIHCKHYSYVIISEDENDSCKVIKKKVIIKKRKGEDSDSKEVTYFYSTDDDDHFTIKEIGEGEDIKVVKVKKAHSDEKEYTIKVIADTDDIKSDDIEIIIEEADSGTVFVSKNIKVIKSVDEGDEKIKIIVEIEEVDKEKAGETKQIKKEKRIKK